MSGSVAGTVQVWTQVWAQVHVCMCTCVLVCTCVCTPLVHRCASDVHYLKVVTEKCGERTDLGSRQQWWVP